MKLEGGKTGTIRGNYPGKINTQGLNGMKRKKKTTADKTVNTTEGLSKLKDIGKQKETQNITGKQYKQ